jgi:spore coat protein U-like protein
MKYSSALKTALCAAALGALTIAPNTATAATAVTTTFTVTANVVPACTITATNLGFGNYVTSDVTALTAQSTVTVTCGNGVTFNLGLNGGQSGNTAARAMKNGAATLNYQLYSDASMATVWGNVSGSWVTQTSTGVAIPLPVYGKIPAAQVSANGAYTDTITATVNY